MGIPVADPTSEVAEADVSRILARIERERRAGHKDVSEALAAAIENGYTNIDGMRNEALFAPIADTPEFIAVFAGKNP